MHFLYRILLFFVIPTILYQLNMSGGAGEDFLADVKFKLEAFSGTERKKLLIDLKEMIDSAVKRDELIERTQSFRVDLLETLKRPIDFFDDYESEEEGEDGVKPQSRFVIPPILSEIAANLECTDYSIESADYHVSSSITVNFGDFSVSRTYDGDNEGSGDACHTIRAGKYRVHSRDSYFADVDLSKVYEVVASKLPGVDIELFRKFCGYVYAEDFEF